MTSTVSISNQSITFDVNLVYCGFENSPTHDYRPHTQDSYVIQYVICGEGFYTLENRTYKIKKGDMFLIPLNHVCHYWADKTNPYQYYYISFLGSSVSEILSCAGFSVANPIISYTDPKLEQIFATILKHFSTDSCTSFTLAHAAFINLFACLFEKVDINNILSKNSKAEYVQKAKAFIQNNFSQAINVSIIAKALGLNRTYLSTIFMKVCDVTLINYLIEYRLTQAMHLLMQTDFSITKIALDCGFSDSKSFYVRFKNKTGLSPKRYRLLNMNQRDLLEFPNPFIGTR